jgi:hypothetical protein
VGNVDKLVALFLLPEKKDVSDDMMLTYCCGTYMNVTENFQSMKDIEADVLMNVTKFRDSKKIKYIEQNTFYALEISFVPDEVSSEKFECWKKIIMEFFNRLNQALKSICVFITESKELVSLIH